MDTTGRQDTDDESIIAAIAMREHSALSQLYTRYADLLMGVAYRILQNRTDAEDLVHDVFLEIWNKAGSYDRRRGRVKTWLALITRSRALDRVRTLAVARKYAMIAHGEGESVTPQASPETSLERSLEQSRLHQAVAALNEPQREVLRMNYFEGLSCQEISLRLNAPRGTIKSRLRAAVAQLRNVFETSEERA